MRTVSAGANYFLKFNKNYGGSTITQQLIKNVTENDDYSFQRKIQEIFWALDLEKKMDKKEILTLYLNIINMAQGNYGVGAAADYYFSKPVNSLTLIESACITAITNNPSYYNPIRNPENNAKRRNLILREMLNQGYITQEEFDSAYEKEIELNVNTKYTERKVNSWYVDMVVEDVISDLVEKGYSTQMASLMIYTGGLKIYTCMDYGMQTKLETYYADTANFYKSEEETLQSSMIIIHPETGEILAVAGAVGGKSANRLQSLATQALRPAGSTIKPLAVYGPLLERGQITWSSVYDDTPVNFGKYNLDPQKGPIVKPVAWPQNATLTYRGLSNINYSIEN